MRNGELHRDNAAEEVPTEAREEEGAEEWKKGVNPLKHRG
jgi:hypothetical protein